MRKPSTRSPFKRYHMTSKFWWISTGVRGGEHVSSEMQGRKSVRTITPLWRETGESPFVPTPLVHSEGGTCTHPSVVNKPARPLPDTAVHIFAPVGASMSLCSLTPKQPDDAPVFRASWASG